MAEMEKQYFLEQQERGFDIEPRELKTEEGFIRAYTSLQWRIEEKDRYLNPKMELELVNFKKKIVYRHAENAQIPKDWAFPRAFKLQKEDLKTTPAGPKRQSQCSQTQRPEPAN